jgi:ferredoxin
VAPAQSRDARFDLVLDFSATPLFRRRHPPQGYFHAPQDDAGLLRVLDEMREAVGEFEKPRFFSYRENLCAHQRSEIVGCNACIDICSTEAIRADGDHVKVDPHLCMGCGACSTVCPSGAMSYQFPPVSDRGDALKRELRAYGETGARDACLVFHDGMAGRELLAAAGALPPRALPIESWHVASIGLDLLLPAIAFGASQVAVVASPAEDREYVRVLREQMAIGETVLEALGYAGTHFILIEPSSGESLAASLASLQPAGTVETPATFLLANDKRTAIEFAVEHLFKQARTPVGEIPLPAGAPFGEVLVDRAACTMCMSCVGACPASALLDGVDQPLLKFIERNCVQCGLCEETCPENAITLRPRLLLTPAVREARLLNETEPFHCVSCNKPFGTRQMVDAMLGRLAGHSMFSRPGALRRLQMCSDCRVVDMMSNKDEVSVLTLGDPNR